MGKESEDGLFHISLIIDHQMDVSIQTGVQARVARILGDSEMAPATATVGTSNTEAIAGQQQQQRVTTTTTTMMMMMGVIDVRAFMADSRDSIQINQSLSFKFTVFDESGRIPDCHCAFG